jgi:Zn-dependent protease
MAAPEPMTRQRALVLLGLGLAGLYLLVRRHVISGESLLLLVALVPSVILHEVSHGAVALLFGDDTAKRAGRLTLNPVRHIDPLGTVLLPAMLVLAGAPPFGYAKPVPVNPRRLRNPRDHGLLVSLVGPGVNIAIAVAAAVALRLLGGHAGTFGLYTSFGDLPLLQRVLFLLGYINVVLAAFNLIPIPPLDGSAVVERLLPARWWPGYLRLRQYSMVILIVVVLALPQLLGRIFDPAIALWERLLV